MSIVYLSVVDDTCPLPAHQRTRVGQMQGQSLKRIPAATAVTARCDEPAASSTGAAELTMNIVGDEYYAKQVEEEVTGTLTTYQAVVDKLDSVPLGASNGDAAPTV